MHKTIGIGVAVTMASLLSPSTHFQSAATYEKVRRVFEVKVNET